MIADEKPPRPARLSMDSSCTIDDVGPLPVHRPQDVPELSDLVRRAAADGQALYPAGGRTSLGLGNPPARPGWLIDTRGLDQVVDYPARDMTITVRTGITLGKLRTVLAAENQRLPVDIALADQATLGGALAADLSGPRRYGCGTLRDYLLGISAVNDEGQEFKAGGRVVKNVAGYDLCKLLIGSLGTLGILTQATLKVPPAPEEHALVLIPRPDAGLQELADRLHGSRTRPVCLELLDRRAAAQIRGLAGRDLPEADWLWFVGYEGNAEAVAWQVQHLVREIGPASTVEAVVGSPAAPLWTALVEHGASAGGLHLKASVLPGALPAFCRTAAADGAPALRAHAGNGIVHGFFEDDLTREQAGELVDRWRTNAATSGGHVVVRRCPAAWKSGLSVWGPPPPALDLMRAVKQRFDPRGLFNPGRFVGGI